jgi:hypothetical protein
MQTQLQEMQQLQVQVTEWKFMLPLYDYSQIILLELGLIELLEVLRIWMSQQLVNENFEHKQNETQVLKHDELELLLYQIH